MSLLDRIYVEQWWSRKYEAQYYAFFIFDEKSKTIRKWREAFGIRPGDDEPSPLYDDTFQTKVRSAFIKDGVCYMKRENKRSDCKTHYHKFLHYKNAKLPQKHIDDLPFQIWCEENNKVPDWSACREYRGIK